MKVKKGFVLRPTMGYTLVVATGELAKTFDGVIKLNETSADIWTWIAEGMDRDAVIARYALEYRVGLDIATSDVDTVIANMKEAEVFED